MREAVRSRDLPTREGELRGECAKLCVRVIFPLGPRLPRQGEAIRLRIVERPQEDPVHDAEHRRRGAHRESDGRDHRRGKSHARPQSAE